MSYWDYERNARGREAAKQHGRDLAEQVPGVKPALQVLDAVDSAEGLFSLTQDQKEKLFLIHDPSYKKAILRQCGVCQSQHDKMELLPTWPKDSEAIIRAMVARLGGIAFRISAYPVGVQERRTYWAWHEDPTFRAVKPNDDMIVQERGRGQRHIQIQPMKM